MPDNVKTLDQLFKFYYDFVKPLYSSVQTDNVLPDETLFEINAAFDHLSRHWYYGEPEETSVEKSFSHLKRSCLDIFKLKVKAARDQFEDLRKIDTSLIDNGEFDGKMRASFQEIKTGAVEARRFEGQTKTDETVAAFTRWLPVYEECVNFENTFYLHPSLEWAKKKSFRITAKRFALSIISAGVAGAFLKDPLSNLLKWIWNKLF